MAIRTLVTFTAGFVALVGCARTDLGLLNDSAPQFLGVSNDGASDVGAIVRSPGVVVAHWLGGGPVDHYEVTLSGCPAVEAPGDAVSVALTDCGVEPLRDYSVALVGVRDDGRRVPAAGSPFRFGVVPPADAQPTQLAQPPSPRRLAYKMAADAETMVAGARLTEVGGDAVGVAYVYESLLDAYAIADTLVPTDGVSGDSYGYDVAIDGDVLAVAAANHDVGANSGAVYVLRRGASGWVEEQMIAPADGTAYTQVNAVDVRGDDLVFMTRNPTLGAAPGGGGVYFYRFDGGSWVFAQRIESPSGSFHFGEFFSLGDGVAALGDYDAFSSNGRAMIVRRLDGIWQVTQELTPGTATADFFGAGVALNGTRLYVGASRAESGVLYVYDDVNGTFEQRERFVPSDLPSVATFGWGLESRGPYVLVGAHSEPNTFVGEARLYVDTGEELIETNRFPSPLPLGAEWSQAVALTRGALFVGAQHAAGDAGLIYVWP